MHVKAERLLWHQRLCHPGDHILDHAWKHMKGVPRFQKNIPTSASCPTCIASKMKKRAPGKSITLIATLPHQGLSIDFGFVGHVSVCAKPVFKSFVADMLDECYGHITCRCSRINNCTRGVKVIYNGQACSVKHGVACTRHVQLLHIQASRTCS